MTKIITDRINIVQNGNEIQVQALATTAGDLGTILTIVTVRRLPARFRKDNGPAAVDIGIHILKSKMLPIHIQDIVYLPTASGVNAVNPETTAEASRDHVTLAASGMVKIADLC